MIICKTLNMCSSYTKFMNVSTLEQFREQVSEDLGTARGNASIEKHLSMIRLFGKPTQMSTQEDLRLSDLVEEEALKILKKTIGKQVMIGIKPESGAPGYWRIGVVSHYDDSRSKLIINQEKDGEVVVNYDLTSPTRLSIENDPMMPGKHPVRLLRTYTFRHEPTSMLH